MMLRRKRWRALRRRPGQSLALALVLGLGVAAFTLKVLAVTVIGLVPGAPLDWWAAGGAMRDFPDFIPAGIGLYPAVVAVVVVAATLADGSRACPQRSRRGRARAGMTCNRHSTRSGS